ncbi:hypothetical protein BHM03_00051664 [Ensete ventricosum]|nr:hypothetical protein BHM03_00051664 [Ensete ventricosum]
MAKALDQTQSTGTQKTEKKRTSIVGWQSTRDEAVAVAGESGPNGSRGGRSWLSHRRPFADDRKKMKRRYKYQDTRCGGGMDAVERERERDREASENLEPLGHYFVSTEKNKYHLHACHLVETGEKRQSPANQPCILEETSAVAKLISTTSSETACSSENFPALEVRGEVEGGDGERGSGLWSRGEYDDLGSGFTAAIRPFASSAALRLRAGSTGLAPSIASTRAVPAPIPDVTAVYGRKA